MYRNKDFIYEATSKLEELSRMQIQVDNKKSKNDTLLNLIIPQSIIESKSALSTSTQLIVFLLEKLKNNDNLPTSLITKKFSKIAVLKLKKRNIHFLDSADHTYIKYLNLMVFMEGKKILTDELQNIQ
ncbi:MAG: hypothetical protein ACTH5N_00325 [Psychroflexus halocasei]|uniref:hypothetical protein n=1 Tax=Psychroflexus sp. S27 TaxID=1982757 RepID=UPI000C296CE9|nr:hypothetical protein [Psychroflexus sp. S27]